VSKKRKSTSAPPKRTTRMSELPAISPGDWLDAISDIWARELQGKSEPAAEDVAALALGTIMAAKLLVRLTTNGGLSRLSRQAILVIEKESDALAHANWASMGRALGQALDVPEATAPVGRSAVETRTDWHWTSTPVDDDEEMPAELDELLSEDVACRARHVAAEIIRHFAERRSRVTDHARVAVAELVAAVAAAKGSLALWGSEPRAAFVERFAELACEFHLGEVVELSDEN
jgi:hypothetical protein